MIRPVFLAHELLTYSNRPIDRDIDYDAIIVHILTDGFPSDLDDKLRDVLYRVYINHEDYNTIAEAYNESYSSIYETRFRAEHKLKHNAQVVSQLLGASDVSDIDGTYPIVCLGLPINVFQALHRELGTHSSISDLSSYTKSDLIKMKGITKASANNIESKLQALGLNLKEI